MLNEIKKPKVKVFKGFWTIENVKSDNKSLFIFGDNDFKKGKKGQAIIRDEKNSIGIPTKKLPSYAEEAYYTDSEYELNKGKIDKSMEKIKERLKVEGYEYIVLPENGIGTGLAKLDEKAPKTFSYLQLVLQELIKDFN
jgi:hypothetical protein